MHEEPPIDAPADHDVPADRSDTPSVDELQARLDDIDAAMQLLQNGELDAADAAIDSLERRVGLASD